MLNIFAPLDALQNKYSTLPVVLRQSFLPYFVISLPLVVASLFSIYHLMPFVMLGSAYLLYAVTVHTDTYIFTLTKMQSRVRITLPMVFFISVWAIALAFFSRKEMMLGVVGPYVSLLMVCTAPAYRIFSARQKRRIPLDVSFGTVTLISFLASLNYINHTL